MALNLQASRMSHKNFQVIARCPKTQARLGRLTLPHGEIETPVFMPVGTRGTVKAMTPQEVAAIGYRLILGNTFHLELRPGSELIQQLGGLRKFMNWPHAILTDSGGYQVFSLAAMRKITEEGAEFRSPYDGALCRLTPESAIQIQHRLGADVIMAFDECLEYGAERGRVEKSMDLTLRWLARCQAEHEAITARDDGDSTSHLFGIAQGGFFSDLREASARRTVEVDLPGYAIGGLSVGEPEPLMMEMLEASVAHLPADRPRYAMGIGLPLNLIDMVMRGVDMFDCVVPTRNARNGRVYTFKGVVILKHASNRDSAEPIEADCPCDACRNYTRAYLRHLYLSNEILASRLATLHNLTFFWRLMERIRAAIPSGALENLRSDLAQFYEHTDEAEESDAS
jgi:queuine tRNA-ribosyltransferase